MLGAIRKYGIVMSILEILGLGSPDDIDETRPLSIGPFNLGVEAAVQARKILANSASYDVEVQVFQRPVQRPVYWYALNQDIGSAEIVGIPESSDYPFPTAIEVSLVTCLQFCSKEDRDIIFGGNAQIICGSREVFKNFKDVVIFKNPACGSTILFDSASEVIVSEPMPENIQRQVIKCIANAHSASPLKFKFLEFYRVLESVFLFEVKSRIISHFDLDPGAAVSAAADALKSEMSRIMDIAESKPRYFEEIYTIIYNIKNTNQFANAIYSKATQKIKTEKKHSRIGAAFIYQIRCSIVHAGETGLIFERYPDGEQIVELITRPMEMLALSICGFEILP